jgi:predicted acylesterase/phospholipase RssA
MAHASPKMLLRINRVLAERLRLEVSSGRPAPRHSQTIALIPLSPSVPIVELGLRLTESMAAIGSLVHIDRARVERECPGAGAGKGIDRTQEAEVLAWLAEQEVRHQFVIYQGEFDRSAWTDLCIRQADRVVLVGLGADDPALTAVEARIDDLNRSARRELILLHAPGVDPRDTRLWLMPRSLAAHHHVARWNRAHLDRASRRLVGQAIGLVLSGGGARGYIHAGAWRAIEEAGVPIDVIGGTSVGAVMGCAMAAGRDARAVDELGVLFAKEGIIDLTLPLVSFFRSRQLSRLLRRMTSDARIEDLWTEFFCVSTSLTRAEPVVHRDGSVWRAVRASSAIPGLFAPMPTSDGDALVDGGIMNHVPIDVMRSICGAGPIIAINLSRPSEHHARYHFRAATSGWEVLRSRLNPFADRIEAPSIFTTLLSVTEAGSSYRLRASGMLEMADLLVQPPVERAGILNLKQGQQLAKKGYELTTSALDTWLRERPDVPRHQAASTGSFVTR